MQLSRTYATYGNFRHFWQHLERELRIAYSTFRNKNGIPDSHSQLLGMGMTIPNFRETDIPPPKKLDTAFILPTNQYRAGGYPLP